MVMGAVAPRAITGERNLRRLDWSLRRGRRRMIITGPSPVLVEEVDSPLREAVHTLTKMDTRAMTDRPVAPAAPRSEARVSPITSTRVSPRWALKNRRTTTATATGAVTGMAGTMISAVGTTTTAVDPRPLPHMARIPMIAVPQAMIPDVVIRAPQDGAIKR